MSVLSSLSHKSHIFMFSSSVVFICCWPVRRGNSWCPRAPRSLRLTVGLFAVFQAQHIKLASTRGNKLYRLLLILCVNRCEPLGNGILLLLLLLQKLGSWSPDDKQVRIAILKGLFVAIFFFNKSYFIRCISKLIMHDHSSSSLRRGFNETQAHNWIKKANKLSSMVWWRRGLGHVYNNWIVVEIMVKAKSKFEINYQCKHGNRMTEVHAQYV